LGKLHVGKQARGAQQTGQRLRSFAFAFFLSRETRRYASPAPSPLHLVGAILLAMQMPAASACVGICMAFFSGLHHVENGLLLFRASQ